MLSVSLVSTCLLLFFSAIQTKYLDEEDMLLFWKRSGSTNCKPFSTYSVACNRCVCGADGIEYCTRMACLKKSRRSDDSDYSDQD